MSNRITEAVSSRLTSAAMKGLNFKMIEMAAMKWY